MLVVRDVPVGRFSGLVALIIQQSSYLWPLGHQCVFHSDTSRHTADRNQPLGEPVIYTNPNSLRLTKALWDAVEPPARHLLAKPTPRQRCATPLAWQVAQWFFSWLQACFALNLQPVETCAPVVVQQQQQPEQAEQPNLPEVFDLVLSSSADARLLCTATAVRSYFRELAATSIRQRWPDLLVQTVKGAAKVSCTGAVCAHLHAYVQVATSPSHPGKTCTQKPSVQ